MRHSKATLALIAIAVAAVCVSTDASSRPGGSGGHRSSARGGHAHAAGRTGPHHHFASRARLGIFLGAPVFAAPYFYRGYPVPYLPPIYVPPMEYIEQTPDPAYWYFCPGSNAYYPYVKQCPGGWQQVLPTPDGSSQYLD